MLAERFWDKVAIIPFHECWEWIAFKDNDGYGRIYTKNSRGEPAHRVSLRLHGFYVPSNMIVDHKCKNRACVRPDHLRIVTPSINALENSDSICVKNANKTHCTNGHSLSGNNLKIIREKKGNLRRRCWVCARAAWRKSRQKLKNHS